MITKGTKMKKKESVPYQDNSKLNIKKNTQCKS